jgi:heme/copper-type cytochrome/quinol oxidase subunit 2
MSRIIVGKVTIEISDDGFAPDYFESAVGRDVTITLVNSGSRTHTFTIDRLNVDVALAPGETTVVQIDLPKLGEYVFRSTAPGDEAFRGKMVVFI